MSRGANATLGDLQPLVTASKNLEYEVVKMLLDMGVDPDIEVGSTNSYVKASYTVGFKKCNNLKNTTLGWEPILIIYYIGTEFSTKQPTQNYEAALQHVNCVVVYHEISYRIAIMDPYIVAFLWTHCIIG